jgi:hypothetical protein
MNNEWYERICRSMTNLTPTKGQIERIEKLRTAYKSIAKIMLVSVPDSRESRLSSTKLEESLMWAVKSIILEED